MGSSPASPSPLLLFVVWLKSQLFGLFDSRVYASHFTPVLLLLLVLGLYTLIRGSHFILTSASKLARLYHVSEYLIGTTIVALSTSLPEVFVSIGASAKKLGVIVLGNVIGSNIFNIALIFMLLCIFSRELFKVKLSSLILLMILNLVLILLSVLQIDSIPRIAGAIALGFLLLSFIKSYKPNTQILQTSSQNTELSIHSHGEESELPSSMARTVFRQLLLFVLGVLCLYLGSELFLNSTREIGTRLHLSDEIIGLIFVALGTSLPELMVTITSIYFMQRSKYSNENFQDIAEGNLIGSNIFNILGVLGLALTVHPVSGISKMLYEILVMTCMTLLMFLLLFQNKKVQKFLGIILCVLFISYLIFLFNR